MATDEIELKPWMQAHGYSVRALARKIDVTPRTIYRWRTEPPVREDANGLLYWVLKGLESAEKN